MATSIYWRLATLLNWFENRGSEGFELRWLPSGWSADSGTGARAADIDGDGRMDVVAGRVRTRGNRLVQEPGERRVRAADHQC